MENKKSSFILRLFLGLIFLLIGGAIGFFGRPVYETKAAKFLKVENQTDNSKTLAFNSKILDTFKKLHKHKTKVERTFDDLFDNDFFSDSKDPFEDIRKMRERLKKHFQVFKEQGTKDPFNQLFDRWFDDRFGGGVDDITMHEDENFIYYDIGINKLARNTVDVKVANGMIEITGKVVTAAEDTIDKGDHNISAFHASFERSFPVPQGVDATKYAVDAKEDKIEISFPKLK